jgi:crossover junction endodeoxyribonuclease RusA
VMFHLTVPGKPLPKGSLRHIGKGRMIEQTNVKQWMSVIRAHATQATGAVLLPIETPVEARLEFRFPRPAAAKNRLYPHMRSVGDIDKLCRAVLDALQPEVITDDSLVVRLSASKDYETAEQPAGVSIHIEELT